jgi:DNA sulfur modification protein DndC
MQLSLIPDPDSSLSSLPVVMDEIREIYQKYSYPWIIGYSGGKDSTSALQLVWNAIEGLPIEKRNRKVYVISSDTLVETPMIVDHVNDNIRLINEAAAARQMPFYAQKLTPAIQDTFWVNLIGRGYPAPTSIFRWCTDRLKIQPSNRFIINKVSESGEVILVLGVRRGESMTRDQVINMHRFTGHKLAHHGQLPGAWVYMPIEHFTSDDVWTYLIQTKSPWGGNNRDLSSLYRSAQSGECPLVVDTHTPSCGNSRFGCWTCTVVTRDRSMEAMIDSGEEWMIPLLEFRDWLSSTQDPEVKPAQREYRGRDGHIKITQDGQLRYRTYKLEFSKEMLAKLLNAQCQVQKYKPDFTLIENEELQLIRQIWITERQDWADSLPRIFEDGTGKSLAWRQVDVVRPGKIEARVLDEVANKHAVPMQLVQKLLDVEWQNYGMRRRSTIHTKIQKILNEDWRSLDEVKAIMESRQNQSYSGNKSE